MYCLENLEQKTFRQFFLESRHSSGTYVAVIPDAASMKKLVKWSKKAKIQNPIKEDDYHTTVVYSRKGIPKAKKHVINFPINAKIKEWKLFGDNQNCLVALLDCPQLKKEFDTYTKAYGAVSDYPEYLPHITFSYDFVGDLPDSLPDFEIVFDHMKFQPIDPDWNSKDES